MYDVIVIGGGITGSAVSYELSKYKLKIAILEKENDVSLGATKANSGIIHAGFDPKPHSLMARLNVRGSRLAQEVCKKLDIPYKKCGAMVVAFDDEKKEELEKLLKQGEENGVQNQAIIDGDGARALEPNLSENVKWALLEPDSAIVSPWEFCLALAETAVRNGAELFLDTEVTSIKKENGCWKVNDNFEGKIIVNAAGINADKIHDMPFGYSYSVTPRSGEYYLLDKSEGTRVSRTIFQVPDKNGKGVLVSPTVHGNLIVGPDSKIVQGNDTKTTFKALDFVKDTAFKSVPSINFGQNIRNFAGVRARTDINDFIIKEVKENGKNTGFIDAAGICSPGLSASLAIAEYVADIVKEAAPAVDLTVEKKDSFTDSRKKIRFKELSAQEKAELIGKNPAYAHIVCRCETITEGEILDSFDSPVPPRSLDGIKRRAGTGMGRCQGGFCAPSILPMLAEKLKVNPDSIVQEPEGSEILTGGELHV